jgi:hypothetical protein
MTRSRSVRIAVANRATRTQYAARLGLGPQVEAGLLDRRQDRQRVLSQPAALGRQPDPAPAPLDERGAHLAGKIHD